MVDPYAIFEKDIVPNHKWRIKFWRQYDTTKMQGYSKVIILKVIEQKEGRFW